MTTKDFTIVRGTRAGILVPGAVGEVYARLVSPQDGFPLLHLKGIDGVIVLDPSLTGKLGFSVADYYVWDADKVLLQRGRIRVWGPYPDIEAPKTLTLLNFTGPGPHPVSETPSLVFVNGVLFNNYQVLTEGVYLPGIGMDDDVTVLLWG